MAATVLNSERAVDMSVLSSSFSACAKCWRRMSNWRQTRRLELRLDTHTHPSRTCSRPSGNSCTRQARDRKSDSAPPGQDELLADHAAGYLLDSARVTLSRRHSFPSCCHRSGFLVGAGQPCAHTTRPALKFPTAPRDRVCVASYPFSANSSRARRQAGAIAAMDLRIWRSRQRKVRHRQDRTLDRALPLHRPEIY